MPHLTREQLADRLRLVDYRLAIDMRCPVMEISAHATKDEATRCANPITRPADAHHAWFYRVGYRIKTLLGPHRYSDPAQDPVQVLINLNANGNYPFSRPESYVIGRVLPWSPHFAPGIAVCFERPGRVWRSDGKTTLGHLLLHLARLINFDEVIADQSYGGYNPDAVKHWRSALHAQPITPDLPYPVLPPWFFHGETLPANPVVSGVSKKAVVSALNTQPATVNPVAKGTVVVRKTKATVIKK